MDLASVTTSTVSALSSAPAHVDLFSVASQHRQAGHLKAAQDACYAALRINPHDHSMWNFLGVIAQEAGQLLTAIEHFKKAIAGQSRDVNYQINLAEIYRRTGQPDAAIALALHALALSPECPSALHTLGIAHCDRGDYRGGLSYLARAVSRAPNKALYHANLGFAFASLGHPEQAIVAYDNALLINPTDDHTKTLRAVTHLLLGNLPEGFAGFEIAFVLDWGAARVRNPLGRR